MNRKELVKKVKSFENRKKAKAFLILEGVSDKDIPAILDEAGLKSNRGGKGITAKVIDYLVENSRKGTLDERKYREFLENFGSENVLRSKTFYGKLFELASRLSEKS